jgi:hypothetical protein
MAAGAKTILMAAEELGADSLEMAVSQATEALTTSMWADWYGLSELLIRFLLNTAVIALIVRVFYYPKSKRRDYFVTFILISISVFLLIFLMGGVKLKVGFALGLFAIFGIIRYRTESVPIREMTYLFLIIAVSAINGLATSISYVELLATNLLFIISIWHNIIFSRLKVKSHLEHTRLPKWSVQSRRLFEHIKLAVFKA